MDTTNLMLSMLFGTVGLGFFVYGKKGGQLIPLIVGLALMTIPYFISDAIIMSLVCIALTLTPFIAPNF